MKLKINHTLLIQALYFALTATTGYQKTFNLPVPEWFLNKFKDSFLAAVPYGLNISFFIITLLELAIAIAMLVSVFKKEYKQSVDKTVLNFGLDLSLLLFVILVFGSFLVGDYDNGALDFLYFIGTLYIRKTFLKTTTA